jgi:hypothetical protein
VGRHDYVEVLAREDVPELASLLLQPRNGLGISDLSLAVRDLPDERRVLGCKCVHLRIEAATLRNLTVHGKRHQAADPGDEHDGKPAQRDRTVERRTWIGTDETILSGAG